ncbi:MAG: efflux transporter outer membrane subunit [Thermodesulfovibrionales bacterium]
MRNKEFIILIFISLASCTVGPDYVKPSAEVPVAYKESAGWKLAEPKDTQRRGAWWGIFNDPQLNELEELIPVANQNVVAAEAQLRQARALVQATRAGAFPSITAGASATRSRRSGNLGSSLSSGAGSDYQIPVDASWELDLWGRIRRSVEANEAEVQASAADLASVRLSAQAALAQYYFQLRTLRTQKELLDEAVSQYQRSLDLTQNRYAAGVAAKVDVLQAETQLKSTKAQAIDLKVQIAQLQHAISVLIGKPASDFSIDNFRFGMTIPSVPVGLPSELLERRPDIASAERRMAAANAQIGVAKAAYFPTIRLSAAAGLEASSLARWISWPSRFWAVGSTLSETVFDAGLRSAQNKQAVAVFDASVAAYRQTVLVGFQEVEDNLSALRTLQEEATIQDEAVAAARQTLEVTVNQYRSGTVSYLNVIVAQTAELASRRTSLDIFGRRSAATVFLIKALGGGWDPSSSGLTKEGGSGSAN